MKESAVTMLLIMYLVANKDSFIGTEPTTSSKDESGVLMGYTNVTPKDGRTLMREYLKPYMGFLPGLLCGNAADVTRDSLAEFFSEIHYTDIESVLEEIDTELYELLNNVISYSCTVYRYEDGEYKMLGEVTGKTIESLENSAVWEYKLKEEFPESTNEGYVDSNTEVRTGEYRILIGEDVFPLKDNINS